MTAAIPGCMEGASSGERDWCLPQRRSESMLANRLGEDV
jgi:hypothetical protein